ncbi:DUF6898 family protein [Govanella unica]|uniref:Serine hydroxymethyltransferase n=1 Tax=Govanella unica TaxID=2975056 RepID=A0A9X3TYL7_9PROT|nr:hypothetical protein [Govania unica]MDA5194082.1 serine hydroxymethyltransferase [Govania unica]
MSGQRGNYIVEFLQIGNSVKVSAIDPVTGLEVSIVGSPLSSRETLSRSAIRKLETRLQATR